MATKNTDSRSAEERAIDQYVDMMTELVERISADWQQPWFTSHYQSTPLNLAGRKYNGMNYFFLQMLCDTKGYKTPCFATHAQITKYNYDKDGNRLKDNNGEFLPFVSIIKGEKSCPVFMTIFNVKDRKTGERISYDEYNGMSDDEKNGYNVYPNLKVFYVFNIDQTNLSETRPDAYKKIVKKYGAVEVTHSGKKYHNKKIDDMIESQNWFCPIEVGGDSASYSPVLDRVKMPEFKKFKTGEQFYSTLFHEMAHSLGHESRLNRADGMTAKFGSVEYGIEELTAEMTAALVCHTMGFDNVTKEESATYLKGWMKKIKENTSIFKKILIDVKRCYSKMSDRVCVIE